MSALAIDVTTLLAGFAILIAGGEALVRGASAIARQSGISPLVIGLTVVAFGTSAPELAVNVLAAIRGNGALSFGNIVGSNLANVGIVVGLTAIFRPLIIETSIVRREIPMLLLATIAALVMASDRWLAGTPDFFSRGDALILLLLFGVFIYYTVRDVYRQRDSDPYIQAVSEAGAESGPNLSISSVLVVVGVAALVLGAEFTVRGATGMARAIGMSEALIGLTLVAIGTSLPELSASLVAAWRGHTDLAVGNVVGSCILNLLLILGISGLARPIAVPAGGQIDLCVALFLSVLLMGVCSTHSGRIMRYEGAVLVAIYLLYLGQRAILA